MTPKHRRPGLLTRLRGMFRRRKAPRRHPRAAPKPGPRRVIAAPKPGPRRVIAAPKARRTVPYNADQVLKQHEGLVRAFAHRYARRYPMAHIDDLLQEGRIGLLEAAKRHVQRPGATFGTHAALRIRSRVARAARLSHHIPVGERAIRKRKGVGITTVSGDERREAGGPTLFEREAEPHEGGIARAHARASLVPLIKHAQLTTAQRRVLKLRFYGDATHEQVAKRLKISRPRAYKIEQAALSRLRAAAHRRRAR